MDFDEAYDTTCSWLEDQKVDFSFPEPSSTSKSISRRSTPPYQRRFKCNQCAQSFREKKNLIAHKEEVHLKKRKYVCPHVGCNVTSNRSFNMKRHNRLMHKDRLCPHPCSACTSTQPEDSESVKDASLASIPSTPGQYNSAKDPSSPPQTADISLFSDWDAATWELVDGSLAEISEIETYFKN